MFRTGKVIRLLIALTALIILAAGLLACRQTPDEEQVRQAIAAVSKAAKAGSASGVIAPLSEDFDGNDGELDRRSLRNMVRIVALRGQRIDVTTGPVTIEHRGARIVATFTVALTSGSGSLLSGRLGVYRVESVWREQDGQWRCYTASWKHVVSSPET